MTDQMIGDVLDGLGITLDLDDGDLVASALVLAKVVGEDGEVSLFVGQSDGLSWLEQIGLVTAAQQVIQQTQFAPRDDYE